MEKYAVKLEGHAEGRKQPLYYHLSQYEPNPTNCLVTLGHYETPCGGCDTITSPDKVYELVNKFAGEGDHILFEGIIIGDDVTRAVETSKKFPFRVIALNTPMDECLKGIQARRDERGDDRPLDPKNTLSRNDRLKRIMARLKDANVNAKWMNREEAFQECVKEFGL